MMGEREIAKYSGKAPLEWHLGVTLFKFVRNPVVIVPVLCLLVGMVAGFSDFSDLAGSINMTSGGIAWVTTMEGDELESEVLSTDDKITLVEHGEGAAEFSTLESMLQWAIGHSDPDELKGAAQEAQRLTPQQLEKKRADIRELMERLRVPSDADLMKIAIADLQNSSLPAEDRQRALQELLVLVEPIDNANARMVEDVADLDKLGGLNLVIAELERPEEELRTTAAWVLGKACQNNWVVQKEILKQRALPRLLEMVRSDCAEEAIKALFAVSALIRNFPSGQEAFYMEGGASLLQDLLSNSSVDIRLQRKSLSLVGDLAEHRHKLTESFGPTDGFLKAVVELVEAPDLDTQEKALMAVRSLVESHDSVRRLLVNECHIDAALERLKLQLHTLTADANQADFVRDLEVLRQEVADSIWKSSENE